MPPLMSHDFNIYPSLLDSFQRFLDYELVAEEPWNKVSEAAHSRGEYLDCEVGEYKLSPDEMADKIESELLDTVNRVDGIPSEAADRGTCFNEIVDCILAHSKCTRNDMTIRSINLDDGGKAIYATMDGFSFLYDAEMCQRAAAYFKGSISQILTEAYLPTKYGIVRLYGFIDEWRKDVIYDIKTTSYYDFGNYTHKWQRYVYPYCAIESGDTDCVKGFEYTIWKWRKTNPLTADVYREYYTYNHEISTAMIRDICERLIEWLILKDEEGLITNRRIFNYRPCLKKSISKAASA